MVVRLQYCKQLQPMDKCFVADGIKHVPLQLDPPKCKRLSRKLCRCRRHACLETSAWHGKRFTTTHIDCEPHPTEMCFLAVGVQHIFLHEEEAAANRDLLHRRCRN
ncbi:hypothetical protein MTO96_040464 [Rhipicephalus appendiculatus]